MNKQQKDSYQIFEELHINSDNEGTHEFEGFYTFSTVKYFLTGFYTVDRDKNDELCDLDVSIIELLGGEDTDEIVTDADLIKNISNEIESKAL